jgi:deoxyribodipyrimidine photo-lyase
MSGLAPHIVWFRQDLRLRDNPALAAAVASGAPIVPVYVFDPDHGAPFAMGGAAKWWLHHSLNALDTRLKAKGSRLVLRRGPAQQTLEALIAETGAQAVSWNRLYDPASIARDREIKASLRVRCASYNASLLREPWETATRDGGPFKVFTPFFRRLRELGPAQDPLPEPQNLTPPRTWPGRENLADWALTPSAPDWAKGFAHVWTPGEAGARQKLSRFLDGALTGYARHRDVPGIPGTSRLSPHLAFGEIGPREVWAAAPHNSPDTDKFLSELAWREFAHHLLFHTPSLPTANWRPAFDAFPWDASGDAQGLRAWTRGRTGFPIVDAGMRELWATGWMHNRVRMIVASFLVKNLMIDWRRGAAWFWDTLVDADLANNSAGWQWVAGSGADAAPFFRIFNPVTQAQTFDPEAAYVKHWVPELAALPPTAAHAPWSADASVLTRAGVVLGRTYPWPIVDLQQTRARALEAFAALKAA